MQSVCNVLHSHQQGMRVPVAPNLHQQLGFSGLRILAILLNMARVNMDVLGNSELKRSGMGEFNSDDHYIYYYGQESLRKNGIALRVNQRT